VGLTSLSFLETESFISLHLVSLTVGKRGIGDFWEVKICGELGFGVTNFPVDLYFMKPKWIARKSCGNP
jgi:hypothetical protein